MKTAHSKTVLRRALLAACLLVAIAWFTPLQVLAASGQSASQAMILGAVVNQTNSTMTISGRNFSSNPLTQPFDAVVNLFVPGVGLVNLPVTAFNPAAQEIKVQLPAAITNAQGTFMLTVQVGTGESKYATLGLTIGGSGTVVVGPQGPKGDPGDPGPQGPIGLTGPVGPEGLPGNDGLDGAQGPVGPQGPIGLTGPQGLKGDKGDTGLQGPIGLTGLQGLQGLTGLTGATGPQGPVGLTGAQGVQGPIGLTGPQGLQGEQGPIGLTGATGAQGARGMTFRGAWNLFYVYVPDDAVAYNGSTWLATVANIGSVPVEGAEWTLLAAKGNTGDTGATGAQGLQGPVGLTGAQGVQGLTGLTGATGAQGPMGLTGLQGLQGLIGLTGATGPQGVAGTNGVDGAQGPIGPQGEQGFIGLTGLTGPQGPIGLTGAQGVQGLKGDKGDTGLQGPIGLTGLQGLQGLLGLTGATGPQGVAGTNGVDGAQGPIGPQGEQGFIGLTGLTGPQGPVGLTGAQGLQGLTGLTGATGAQGPIGLTGPTGPVGPKGDTGATGSFNGSLAGDVTGNQDATVVATVGGQTAANVASGASLANAATTANTFSTIVKRDASGNFAAGAITATGFSGNGSGLTTLNASQLTSGTVPSARFFGTYSSALTLNNAANSFTGNGSGLTALNADNIATGSLGDPRLSTNVPLKNAANTFSSPQLGPPTMMVKAGAASNKALVVMGFPNQNDKLQDWQDSLGVSLASIQADGTFTGDGSGLTNLNAANLTGTINNARITLTATEIPNLDASKITTGTFTGSGSGLTSLNASQLTTGTVPSARLSGTYSSALTLNNAANSFTGSSFAGSFTGNGSLLTSLNASQLTSGTIDNARISLTAAEIPSLDAAKIATGSFLTNRVPALNASHINAGAFGSARIAASAIDSSKILDGSVGLVDLSTDVKDRLLAPDYQRPSGTVVGTPEELASLSTPVALGIGIAPASMDAMLHLRQSRRFFTDDAVLRIEDESGGQLLKIDNAGRFGYRASYGDISFNIRSKATDSFAFQLEDDAGLPLIQVGSQGRFGFRQHYNNCTEWHLDKAGGS